MDGFDSIFENETNRKLIAGLLIISISIYAVYRYNPGLFSILPGFQGMTNGLEGYQVAGTQNAVSLGNPLPTPSGSCGFSWLGSPTIGSASIVNTANAGWLLGCVFGSSHQDTLVLDAQTDVIPSTNPFTKGQTISYVVKNPSGNGYLHVAGQVNVYTYAVDYSIQSGSAGNWNFAGDTVWYNLYSQTWNQVSSDPFNSTISGNAWEAPLYGVVSDVQWCTTISGGAGYNCNQGSNSLDASVVGHALSFYSSPSTVGQTLATLAGQSFNPGTDVNKSLSSVYAPDSRLSRLVYYPITLTNFGANTGIVGSCRLGCTYPSVKLTVTLYTLQLGEYVLTNPSEISLGSRSQGCTGLGCVSEAFGNFFNYIGANQLWLGLIAAFGAIIAVVVILAVFATPVFLALIYYFARRKEGGS